MVTTMVWYCFFLHVVRKMFFCCSITALVTQLVLIHIINFVWLRCIDIQLHACGAVLISNLTNSSHSSIVIVQRADVHLLLLQVHWCRPLDVWRMNCILFYFIFTGRLYGALVWFSPCWLLRGCQQCWPSQTAARPCFRFSSPSLTQSKALLSSPSTAPCAERLVDYLHD